MARKCTEYHYFQHTYWDVMARYNWMRCPYCGKLCKPSRFIAATVLVPIELVIFVDTRPQRGYRRRTGCCH